MRVRNNRKNWLVTDDIGTYEAPFNYSDELETMQKGQLKERYKKLQAWFYAGGKAEKRVITDAEKAETLKKDLLTIHSLKVQQIQKKITSKVFTRELEKSYETKEKEAILALETKKYTYFDLAAQLKGMTSKAYAEYVVNIANEMHNKEKDALRKIDDIRSFISDLIDDKKFFQAKKMLDYISEMSPAIIITASNDDLIELINTYSN